MKVYVTPDDFKNSAYGGFDLREALDGAYDNQSRSAENFIELVTDHLLTWVDDTTFRNFDWDNLTSHQEEHLKKAIIAQAHYTYKEGIKAVGMFSGADDEKGKIFDPNYLASVEICRACIQQLTRGGLFNLNIKNRKRVWPGGSNYGFFQSVSK